MAGENVAAIPFATQVLLPHIFGGEGGPGQNQVSLAQVQRKTQLSRAQAGHAHMAKRHIGKLLRQPVAIGEKRVRLIEKNNIRLLLPQHGAQALKPLFPRFF